MPPGIIESLQEVVDALTRHIVMNQRFGKAFGNLAWQVEPGEPQRDGKNQRLFAIEGDPR